MSKFINQDLANINFSDKNDNNFTNAFREKVNDSHELKDTNVEKSVEDYWNNGYIKLLKDIDSNKVVKIKSNINEILEVYNFKKFQGSDLSFNLTNPYFEELNQQIINFYTSINWVNSFNGNSFPLFFFMLDSILALLTIMILINIKLWEKLFAFLFFIFFYKITASLVELENKYTIIFYCVFVFLVAYKSNFWKPQKDYFPLQVILMLSLHQYLFFILYLVLLTTVESAHKFLLLSIPLYLFVVFKINKKFMKYYFWINNTPKKYG